MGFTTTLPAAAITRVRATFVDEMFPAVTGVVTAAVMLCHLQRSNCVHEVPKLAHQHLPK